eukprot:s261_g12.t1
MVQVAVESPEEVLGLQPGATADEVKAAYRRKVKANHPDKGGDSQGFVRVRTAYLALSSDPNLQASTGSVPELCDQERPQQSDFELREHHALVRELFEKELSTPLADGVDLELCLVRQMEARTALGLEVCDLGAINRNERGEDGDIYNQCFYLALARSYLGCDSDVLKETALMFKRNIEAAVLAAHPEWGGSRVGEDVQAFSDFLFYVLGSHALLAELSVAVFDASSGGVELYIGHVSSLQEVFSIFYNAIGRQPPMPQPHVAVPIKVEDSTNGSVWALNNVDDDVPRNGMSQNGVGDERARQLMRDASDLFEGHIAGLVKAFQLLQQQSMELLQAPQPTGISCFPCAPEPSNQDIIMQPTFEVQLALPEDRRPSKPSRAISGYDGSMDLGPKMERRPSISAEDRLLKQQFHRWADASQTLITAESLVKILRLFLGDDEFEDIQAMVHFLTGKEADPQIDSPATEQTGHQSFGDQLLGGLGIRQKSTELSEGLDFESFVRLRQQVSFSGASSSVKRDIGKLQSALRGEELQVLFGEEAPLQEENEGYSNGAAPPKKVGSVVAKV